MRKYENMLPDNQNMRLLPGLVKKIKGNICVEVQTLFLLMTDKP